MGTGLLETEFVIQISIYAVILLIVALLELILPRRRLAVSKSSRWTTNISIAAVNVVILRLFARYGAIGTAAMLQRNDWGLFNRIDLPFWFIFIFSVLLMDFIIYLQHIAFHAFPLLWRLHRVHHTDVDFDLTTGIRFHPVEIFLSMGLKVLVVLVFGIPPIAALVSEATLDSGSIFNHGNFRIQLKFDRYLRWLVVTPDMHRVHHSVQMHENNSNFGFFLPWWDRLMGTYRDQPQEGHREMSIGLTQYKEAGNMSFARLVQLPFERE